MSFADLRDILFGFSNEKLRAVGYPGGSIRVIHTCKTVIQFKNLAPSTQFYVLHLPTQVNDAPCFKSTPTYTMLVWLWDHHSCNQGCLVVSWK